MSPLLEVSALRIVFPPRRGEPVSRPVDGVTFAVAKGETLALVGESGSGKSLTSLAILGLVPPPGTVVPGSRVLVNGRNVASLDEPSLRRLRGGTVGLVFQDATASLDPVYSLGSQVMEAVRAHRHLSRGEAREAARQLLAEVGLDAERFDAYPHQVSGGQRQRAMIAIALAGEPALLIADEPTSALDVTIQAQILELLDGLRARRGMAVLLITHDLGVVAGRADRVAVMYAGQIVETGTAEEVLTSPSHPYTRALLASTPRLDGPVAAAAPIRGVIPRPTAWPAGCRFHPRCSLAWDQCRREEPPAFDVGPGRQSRCWLASGMPQ